MYIGEHELPSRERAVNINNSPALDFLADSIYEFKKSFDDLPALALKEPAFMAHLSIRKSLKHILTYFEFTRAFAKNETMSFAGIDGIEITFDPKKAEQLYNSNDIGFPNKWDVNDYSVINITNLTTEKLINECRNVIRKTNDEELQSYMEGIIKLYEPEKAKYLLSNSHTQGREI